MCFTLHRESVCVCQGWDFFSLPPSLPPSFLFSLIPLPSSPAPLPPPPNTKSVNHKPFFFFVTIANCYLKAQTVAEKVSNLLNLRIKETIFGQQPKVVTTSEEFGGWVRVGILIGKGEEDGGGGYVGGMWVRFDSPWRFS